MTGTEQLSVYRSCAPVVDAWYDPDGTLTLTAALADALAEAKGLHATELPPLFDVIDLDAIVKLFEGQDGAAAADAFLGFTYENWNVFIRADGRIRVCDGNQLVEPEPVFDDVPA